MNQKKTNRKSYIDLLKIMAIYMVLFNHTKDKGFILFTIAQGSKLYPFYLFNAIWIKIAVPLFFMTSGALLLGKEESIGQILKKRVLKYFVVLLAGSVVAYFYFCFRLEPPEKLSFSSFFKTLYTGNHTVAYWYLYSYLAYLLMLPFLRRLAKSMTNQEYLWMFAMFGLMQVLPIIDFLIWKGSAGHSGNFSFFITTSYVFYPFMGYFIDQRFKKEELHKTTCFCLFFFSILAVVLCCALTHYRCMLIGEWTEASCQTFFNTLIFLPSIAVYYGTRMWFEYHSIPVWLVRILSAAGGTTFGIYLFEQIWRNETKPVFQFFQPYIHTLPACWMWILAACVLGGVLLFF